MPQYVKWNLLHGVSTYIRIYVDDPKMDLQIQLNDIQNE